MIEQKFIEISNFFFVDADYQAAFRQAGLTSVDAIFSFSDGKDLTKNNLPDHRSRLEFTIDNPKTTLFLKRYNKPPKPAQIKNWIAAGRRISVGFLDYNAADNLAKAGINVPKIVSYGQKLGKFFEEKSFCITEKIQMAESLETKLPGFFYAEQNSKNLKLKTDFLYKLACFIKKFHATGYRHRDLYLCHIFNDGQYQFYLIDLTRVFKPVIFSKRYLVKDIAQLYYSAPAKFFSRTDRLRFYLKYSDKPRLTAGDKMFIRKVKNKVTAIARHDEKHGRKAPCAGR